MIRSLENSTDAVAILGGSNGDLIVDVNTAFERVTGIARSTALGSCLSQVIGSGSWHAIDECLRLSQMFRGTVGISRGNGSVLHLDVSTFPAPGAEEDSVRWAVALRDVSEQVERDRALHQREEQLRLLAESIRDLVAVHRPGDGGCLYASPAARTILGYEPEEMINRSLYELIHPENLAQAREIFDGHVNGRPESTFVHRMRRRDGGHVWVETTSKTRSSKDCSPEIVSTMRDVSRRKAAEASLTAMHGLLSAVHEAVPLGLCLLDSGGRVQLCNRSFSALFSAEPAGLAGRPITPRIPIQDIESAARRPGALHTTTLSRREGMDFPAELSVTPVRFTSETWRLVTLTDLTERRRIEARLREAGQLESLGTLAGGVAHDFNNLLTIILGYAGLLVDSAGDPVALNRAAQAIIEAGSRGAEVVRQLQLFANQHDLEFTMVDLRGLIEDTIEKTRADRPSHVLVSCTFNHEHARIPMDPTQVAIGLQQLLRNACDAMPQGGTIHVLTGDHPPPGIAAGEFPASLWVTIEDNGSGMDDSTRARIFEPFFARDRGSAVRGLGLAVVYGIMRAHHGMIEVESTPGRGTRVHLAFPRASIDDRQDPHPSTGDRSPAPVPRSTKHVLVVEDETDIAHLWEDIFTSEGIPMVWVRSGEEALRHLADHRDEIGVLFSDIGLPGINGWQVAQHFRAELPNLPLILASGAFRPGDRTQANLAEPLVCLPKPFPPAEIVSHILAMLPAAN